MATTAVEDLVETVAGPTIVETTLTGTLTGTTTGTDEMTAEVILVEEETTGTEDLVETVTGTALDETTVLTGMVDRVVDAGLVVTTGIELLFVTILAEEMGVTTVEAMVQGQLESDSTISTAHCVKRYMKPRS